MVQISYSFIIGKLLIYSTVMMAQLKDKFIDEGVVSSLTLSQDYIKIDFPYYTTMFKAFIISPKASQYNRVE